ncbi:MAG: hypothetical protein Q7S74_04435 [Nanoarchaeota archaeon]|nr:hypothetical protein [Nanoarchaeota archaeon]
MKSKQINLVILSTLIVFLTLSNVSAILISSITVDKITPGNSGNVRLVIENDLSSEITDVSVTLDLKALPLTSIGSAQDSVDKIRKNDDEIMGFKLKSAPDAKAGDYQVPYTIQYTDGDTKKTETGSLGVTISASPELTFTVSTENPVVGQKGKVTLKVVNQGLADAKFVSVRIAPVGFTLLSDDEVYIGSISSDDFETANFDVIFNNENERLSAIIQYTDFDNQKVVKSIDLPITVYTEQKALELGIIKKRYTVFYFIGIILIIILIIVWRMIRKRQRLKRSMKEKEA